MEKARSGFARALRAAFPVTVPVLTGFLCLGVAYGILMSTSGLGIVWTGLMSAVAFGGSMQFVAISLLCGAFAPLQALLLSLMVNARHMFYGLSMLDRYKGLGKARFPLIYMLCDETFSLVSTVEPPLEVAPKDFYLAVTLLDYGYWLAASLLGAAVGDLIPFDTTGIDFALTALFIVILLEQLRGSATPVPALAATGSSLLWLILLGPDGFLLPALLTTVAVLALLRPRLEPLLDAKEGQA